MSFLELICFSAASVALLVIAYAFSHITPLGWIFAFPVLYFWYKIIAGTVTALFSRKKGKQLTRPSCVKGKCQSKDYALVDSDGNKFTFQCRCGDKYLSQGTYFSRIMLDGSLQRYMALQRNGEWAPDGFLPPSTE